MRIDAVHASRLDEAHDGSGALARSKAPSEQPVGSADGDRPDPVLDPVVVCRQLAIVDVTGKCLPPPEAVVDRLGRR